VRLALGASRSAVLRQIVGGALRLTSIGLVLGLAGALALTRLMGTMLFQTTPTDPLTYGIVTLGVVVVALVASAVPAWRASRVEPVEALRYD
jgi:ABC-type antimicrobial peptide transport system permease subunit